MKRETLARVAPFILFMSFIGIDEGIRYLSGKGLLTVADNDLYYLYPVKAIAVFVVLLFFWKDYAEIRFSDFANARHSLLSIGVGLLVFVLWINMDWSFGTQGTPPGFDPSVFTEESARMAMIAFRLFGAALVVPIMEELFWRSFLLRYIIDSDFSKVPIGLFTWPSFLITCVLFGLEHHYILAGVMAGVAFNLLLYKTRSIAQCILCHAVANLALGIYVLQSGEWRFW